MIDVHCHLNFHAFEKDYDDVIKRAFQKGVAKIINVGTKIDSSQKAVELSEKYDSPSGELYAIVGVHPHHADKLEKNVFIKQIELSIKLNLPLQIHNRHAGKDIIEILSSYKSRLMNPPGMFHCMSGDIDFLKKVLDLGFYIGFDGNITYDGLAPGEDTSLVILQSKPI